METINGAEIKLGQCLLFLPYLWGMETEVEKTDDGIVLVGSYRTYEEWKLGSFLGRLTNSFQFLPYLWGMET